MKYLIVIFIGLLISSCASTVKEEMKEYCDCIHGSEEYSEGDCMKMIEEITIKYEFDPEAATEIQEELEKCNTL
jgi:hypothetical protein